MEMVRVDETELPCIVQDIWGWSGRYIAQYHNDNKIEIEVYEIERLLGKPLEFSTKDRIYEAVEVIAERRYWEEKGKKNG